MQPKPAAVNFDFASATTKFKVISPQRHAPNSIMSCRSRGSGTVSTSSSALNIISLTICPSARRARGLHKQNKEVALTPRQLEPKKWFGNLCTADTSWLLRHTSLELSKNFSFALPEQVRRAFTTLTASSSLYLTSPSSASSCAVFAPLCLNNQKG